MRAGEKYSEFIKAVDFFVSTDDLNKTKQSLEELFLFWVAESDADKQYRSDMTYHYTTIKDLITSLKKAHED